MDNFCYGCMKEKKQSPVCEHCGFSEEACNQPHQLPIGALLEHQYVIGRVLGQGGFGITYIGWDEALNRAVAIKEYFPANVVTRDVTKSYNVQCIADRELFMQGRERFLKEAQALARLQNLHEIAQVYNYFVSNGTAYIIMEYVEGVDLKTYIQKKGGKLTAEETLQTLEPLMKALGKIHGVGMIHRDLSPDNIMLKPNGQIVLLDFGTARDVKRGKNPTQAILKPGFAPMEQYQSEGNLGPWTDEYALCATAYYCMTGHIPPESPERLMDKVDVQWDAVPGLSRREIAILDKGMAFNAEDRYPTVEELHDELYRKKDTRWKKVLSVCLIAAVVLLGAAALWMGLSGRVSSSEESTENGAEALSLETLAPDEGVPQSSAGTLRSDAVIMDTDEDLPFGPVFGSEITRREISSITFLGALDYIPDGCWDVSEGQTGKILAWVTESDADPSELTTVTEDDNGRTVENPRQLYDLYIAADGAIDAPEDCSRLFMGYTSLRTIQFNGVFRTEQMVSMKEMFRNCWNLESLDLSGFDTAAVTSMEKVFNGCVSLKSLDLSTFQTGEVTTMKGLFYGCESLDSLDVTGFDTSSVTDLSSMFRDCANLTALELTYFNTAKVKDLSYFLCGCEKLSSVDLSGFNTASVTNMRWLVSGCTSLEKLDLSKFSTVSTVNMRNMFQDCSSLTQLDISSFYTADVTDMTYLFAGCKSLTELDISHFNTANVTRMYGMFEGCGSLKKLNISGLDTSSVTDMRWMFSACKSLEKLDVSNFDTRKVTNMHSMFYQCSMLKELDVSGFETKDVIDMGYMFAQCDSLEKLDVSNFNTSNAMNMKQMFAECGKLPLQDLSGWDVSQVAEYDNFMDAGKTILLQGKKKLNEKPWETLFQKDK